MKNYTVTCLLFLALAGNAQKGVQIGVIAGPQFTAQLNNQDFDNTDVRFNGIAVKFVVGATLNYHFTDALGLGTQVVYSTQGFKYKTQAGIEFFRKVSYVKIPLLFHVNSDSKKLVGGYFYIGPQFNLLIDKNTNAPNQTSLKGAGGKPYDDYVALHTKYSVGGVLGTGIVFNLLGGRLQANAGLRLDGDFIDAYKGSEIVGDPNQNFDPAKPNGNGNYKFQALDKTTGIFAVDPVSGKRSATYNVAAMVEVGVKFAFLQRDRSKDKAKK